VEEQTDSTFIKNISIVLATLVVVTISIAFIARHVGNSDDQVSKPANLALVEQRIKPVADVYTAENGPAPAAPATENTAAVEAVAFDGSLDAEMIFTNVCSACHLTGVAGAPRPGSPEMAVRAEKGLDALMQSATNGLNAMPARGGRVDLSDEQIRAVIEYMTQ